MNTRNLWITGGVAALGLALVALPAPPANSQTACPEESTLARLERKLEQLQAKLAGRNEQAAKLDTLVSSQMALAEHRQAIDQLEAFPALAGDDDGAVGLLDGEDASWLGVELHEVTGETAKELKLPAERGVVVGSIVPDSPAAKAGLKENDVVTEINGQRVEGALQFRRMIREIPSGRTVQLTVWRDGQAQTVSVTLGKGEDRRHSLKVLTPGPGAPGSFTFNMPEIPVVPPMEWDGSGLLMGAQPRLGIDRKSTRLNSSHTVISYAVFCLKKKTQTCLSEHRARLPQRRVPGRLLPAPSRRVAQVRPLSHQGCMRRARNIFLWF